MAELKRLKRLEGRKTTKENANQYYPKFVVESFSPFEQANIYSPGQLAQLPDEQIIYEPVEPGLGTEYEIMVVKDSFFRTLIFSVIAEGTLYCPTWDNTLVTFDDTSVTFGCTTVPTPDINNGAYWGNTNLDFNGTDTTFGDE